MANSWDCRRPFRYNGTSFFVAQLSPAWVGARCDSTQRTALLGPRTHRGPDLFTGVRCCESSGHRYGPRRPCHVGRARHHRPRCHGNDIDGEERYRALNRGIHPFYEPGLEEALAREMAAGRLAFTPEAGNAVHDASVVFICVGTPPRADGEVNLLAVERCAIEIARHAGDEVVVVEKSTGPAGTADRLRLTLAREGGSQRFDIASNPEFLREGSALRDALEPDRIVIGVESERASTVMRLLSEPLTRKGSRPTSPRPSWPSTRATPA